MARTSAREPEAADAASVEPARLPRADRRDALLEYPTLPQGELERIEQLEQLRWLENGWKIRVAEVEHDAISVDIPVDVARVEKLLAQI